MIKGNDRIGYWVGDLPVGCKLCFRGSKSVIFITGLCSNNCFYCPISKDRKFRDVFFINDVEVKKLKDVAVEVAASLSEGAGITGGDPLEVLDRVVMVIRSLKEVFSSKFHIHLYTNGHKLDRKAATLLENAGLDELRIHITSRKSLEGLKIALEHGFTLVVENPVIPGQSFSILELIKSLADIGVKYVNLNELEVSDLNYESFLIRGLKIGSDGRSVIGSKETAIEVLNLVKESGLDVSVHYCPAIYKDLHQYPRRLSRRAIATKRVFETVGNSLVTWLEIDEKATNPIIKKLWLTDLAVKYSNKYMTHQSLSNEFKTGKVVEALPLTPRKILNETSLKRLK
ncbi:MAG: radical SAM protein [Sulfolobales archaeon]